MSSFLAGAVIVLTVIVVNIIAAFINTSQAEVNSLSGCTADDNFTECQQVTTTDFLASVLDVSVSGFDGAPLILNVLWVTIMGILLVVGVIMMVARFIPFLGGD